MDLDKLPSEILIRIFQHLPIKDQLQYARINKKYQEISKIVIPKTKSISIDEWQFLYLKNDSLYKLLKLCSSNLEEFETRPRNNDWPLQMLLKFTCPKLVKLSCTTCSFNLCGSKLIAKFQNIQRLKLWDYGDNGIIIPQNIIFDKLIDLEISQATYALFISLIGKCPNLKCLKFFYLGSTTLSQKLLDDFLSCCPKLIAFQTEMAISWKTVLPHFWSLNSMRYLNLHFNRRVLQDYDLKKISTCFPRLETLLLHRGCVTNEGLNALASLKNLKNLELFSFYEGCPLNVDLGLRKLTECEHLEVLNLETYFSISSTTFVALIRQCQKLREFKIFDVTDVSKKEYAIDIVRALKNDVKRNLSISIFSNKSMFWKSIEYWMKLQK